METLAATATAIRHRRRGSRALAAAAVAALALPGAALAGTASVNSTGVLESEPRGGNQFWVVTSTVTYTAGPGERNDLSAQAIDSDGTVTFRDPGVPLVAGNGCELQPPDTIVCDVDPTMPPAPPGTPVVRRMIVTVALADGDDAAAMTIQGAIGTRLDGGDGDDRISGFSDVDAGPGADEVLLNPFGVARGGAGNDRLVGGTGNNGLSGGEGDDVLLGGDGDDDSSGGPGADHIDGGDGVDGVTYDERTAPVVVDLADTAPDGEAGENDLVLRVERAAGGAGDDMLLGTDDANLLIGRGGDDTVAGRGGDDTIDGEGGNDRLRGGDGDDIANGGAGGDKVWGDAGGDEVHGDSGARDAVRGGSGDDDVRDADGGRLDGGSGDDTVALLRPRAGRIAARCGGGRLDVWIPANRNQVAPRDCERVAPIGSDDTAPPRPRTGRDTIALRVPHVCLSAGRCSISVTIEAVRRGRAVRVAAGRVSVGRRVRTLRMRLTPAGRAALRRASSVRITYRSEDFDGTRDVSGYSVDGPLR